MFMTDYQGRYISDLTLSTEDGPGQPVYICRFCQAITAEPFSHERWHDEGGESDGQD